ncbi:MAG TPA: beta-propeller domain-containing protein [Labilithrix sp.]|nr:beta-propeller domain-containing protein [Labilithrix sp.]
MKTLFLTTLGAGLLGTFAVACSGSTSGESLGKNQQALEALVPLQGCGEVEGYVRARYVAEINRSVDQAIAEIQKSEGGGCYLNRGMEDGAPTAGAGSSSSSSGSSGSPAPAPSSSGKASESSGTNNQVAGVDEADFVKNDGEYLYVVANGALRILKAFPAAEAHAVAKVAIEGTPKKLFVEGDRALVYTSVAKPTSSTSGGGYYGRSAECTYGYDCIPAGDGTATKIIELDISNRAAPVKIRELDLSGSLLAARRIGTAIHTVVIDAPVAIEGLQSYPEMTCEPSEDAVTQRQKAIAAWEALRTKNLGLVAAADVRASLPVMTESGASAVTECGGFFRPGLAEGRSFTSLVSVDLSGGPLTTASVVSDPGVVYASETGLYMSVPHTRSDEGSWYPSMVDVQEASTVHKFRIGATPTLTGYEASGIVKGRVLNQFSLDENEAHLRIATTSGHTPDPKVHSTMSILARQGGALVLTGKVDNIAPTEDIRSVRFDGSRGYVVTFKKTDPLYVFDLGNPTAPSIAGELKIPGFSTYMHMMDAQHLLTIGYDADDKGDFAWFAGVMLQIFDVSDMKNPVLAHKEVIGTRGSSSEALTNHLAFTYFAPKNLLALPMTICEGGAEGSFGTNMTFAGLMVYDATVSGGFALKGKVAHPQTASGGYDSGACSSWWTQASSEVKRSVIMDDFVYSISDKRVKINGLANLTTDLAVLSLED